MCADRARLLGKESMRPCLTVADYVIVGSVSETGDCRGKVSKYKREKELKRKENCNKRGKGLIVCDSME